MMRTNTILGILRKPARGMLLLTAIAASVAMVGCGQKGPLYLPTAPASKAKPVQPAVETTSDVPTPTAR
ncbi:MAG: lipoprotein [Burkholderiaceae bacterium]